MPLLSRMDPGLIKKKLLGKVLLNSLGPQTNIQAPKVQNTAMMVSLVKGKSNYYIITNTEIWSPPPLVSCYSTLVTPPPTFTSLHQPHLYLLQKSKL